MTEVFIRLYPFVGISFALMWLWLYMLYLLPLAVLYGFNVINAARFEHWINRGWPWLVGGVVICLVGALIEIIVYLVT